MNDKIKKILKKIKKTTRLSFLGEKAIARFKSEHSVSEYTVLNERKDFLLVEMVIYSPIKYEDLIVKLIRTEYSIDSEFAILRQRDTKVSDFDRYNAFVEACKELAKKFISERDGK